MQSLDHIDSGNGNGPSNGYSSTRSLNAPITDSDVNNINAGAEDIDYKKLCRQLLRENEQLKRRIKELEEAEKRRDQEFGRERRSMQRTISEHEEELKTMAELKAENVKLKDDNAALIRVISKLSKWSLSTTSGFTLVFLTSSLPFLFLSFSNLLIVVDKSILFPAFFLILLLLTIIFHSLFTLYTKKL